MKPYSIFALALLVAALHGKATTGESGSRQFTRDRGIAALQHPHGGLDDDGLDHFALGRSFFTIPWVEAPSATTARDGLGPLFNANSCASCHKNNGGGTASTLGNASLDRSIIIKLAQPPSSSPKTPPPRRGFIPDPVYGEQLAINGNHDVPFEGQVRVSIESRIFTYPDGNKVLLKKPVFSVSRLNYGPLARGTTLNPRRAPSLIGMGLIDAIPDEQLLARQDEEDRDGNGISGKINWVWSPTENRLKPGRFGWKASTASLLEQTASALHNDMGLTSPLFPNENCSSEQTACNRAYKSDEVDVPMLRLNAISHYVAHLRIPTVQEQPQAEGAELFARTGCGDCHQAGFTTDQGIQFNPFSDFLLHDMGPDLADHSPVFQATASEWRTAPLWGLGLAKTLHPRAGFLHDGRATTVEEAILWHGGEALKARNRFVRLRKEERGKLLSFLNTL